MKLVIPLVLTILPCAALACPVCDQKIALTREQGNCLKNNLTAYLAEAAVLDPVSINIQSCDGSLPPPDTDGTRGGKVPVSESPTPQRTSDEPAELVEWYFLSAAQLRCLQTVLEDAVYDADDRFEFSFAECPN